ncbi:MAG TPA: urease accessory protein UreF [Stellaceae bacterium]
MTTDNMPSGGLYRLFAWLSPSFPTGAFSYSHGLEGEVEAGRVHDRETLQRWIATMIRHGGGRIDADLLRDAYRGDEVGERGLAYRATAELALEASAQGGAFAATVAAAWTDGPRPSAAGGSRSETGEGICHAVAVGTTAAGAGVSLEDALTLYLQSFAANLMSAGLRLGIVGQTDGQRILAALEPVIAEAVAACLVRPREDFGAATFAADIASMRHETQYSRLFRS